MVVGGGPAGKAVAGTYREAGGREPVTTVGTRTVKHTGWGDGWEEVRFERAPGDGFVAHYGRDGELVGVLAHERDEDFEASQERIGRRAPWR